MGPEMFVERLRTAGLVVPEFDYIDAMGLDLSKPNDLGWLQRDIDDVSANLVVIDSLRRLAPSKRENDSDDMAPTVAELGKLARDTGGRHRLIHHKGDSDKLARGSTAIRDQADALFGLLRESEDSAVCTLTCNGRRGAKMRYAPEPDDLYLTVSALDGGIAAAGCASGEQSAAGRRSSATR